MSEQSAASEGSIWDRASVWLATGFGVGFSPIAPGTTGAILGIPIALAAYATPMPAAIVIGLALLGVPVCDRAAKVLNQKDPKPVVWDEFATVPFAFLFLDRATLFNPWVLIAGFALHRFFDITKIPPANRFERFPGGLGVMADDWVAGAYACGSLHLLLKLNIL